MTEQPPPAEPNYAAWWEEAARAGLLWRRECERRDARIDRLRRYVAGLRAELAEQRWNCDNLHHRVLACAEWEAELDATRAALTTATAERDALQAKLDLPCGSCHPCLNWADETWRREGKRPPAVITWEDTLAELTEAKAQWDRVQEQLAAVTAERDTAVREYQALVTRSQYHELFQRAESAESEVSRLSGIVAAVEELSSFVPVPVYSEKFPKAHHEGWMNAMADVRAALRSGVQPADTCGAIEYETNEPCTHPKGHQGFHSGRGMYNVGTPLTWEVEDPASPTATSPIHPRRAFLSDSCPRCGVVPHYNDWASDIVEDWNCEPSAGVRSGAPQPAEPRTSYHLRSGKYVSAGRDAHPVEALPADGGAE